jgi:hypothetical protein
MEAVSPHLVADYGERESAWPVRTLFGEKRPAHQWLHLEQIEVVGRNQFGPGSLRAVLLSQAQRSMARDLRAPNRRSCPKCRMLPVGQLRSRAQLAEFMRRSHFRFVRIRIALSESEHGIEAAPALACSWDGDCR